MKLALLHGSPRKGGNTDRIASMLAGAMRAEAEGRGLPFALYEARVAGPEVMPCLGCRLCFDAGEEACPRKDATLRIREELRDADIVVLSSPVYVGSVSGGAKNWMDRMAFAAHRPEFAGKLAFFLTSAGSMTSMGYAPRGMAMALSLMGFKIAGSLEFVAGALASDAELALIAGKRTKKAARRLVTAYARGSGDRPTFRALLTFAIQQAVWRRVTQESLDLRYWRDKGWLERGVRYYRVHRAFPLKTALARGLGGFIMFLLAV